MEFIKYNTKEISGYLSISVSMIRKLIREKKIPFHRIGTKYLFDKKEIDEWLKSM